MKQSEYYGTKHIEATHNTIEGVAKSIMDSYRQLCPEVLEGRQEAIEGIVYQCLCTGATIAEHVILEKDLFPEKTNGG